MNNETVCAVVVTYNRKELLIECLEALENQLRPVDAVYIVDNASTDGTPKLLLEKGYIDEIPNEIPETYEKTLEKNQIPIHYVRMYENIGGAGGFYEGMKRSYEKSYDWIWVMDDDAEPERDALNRLSDYFNFKNIQALCGIVKDPKGNIENHRGYINSKLVPPLNIPLKPEEYNKEIIEIEFASFVGLMINKRILKQIGYPKKEFFIHNDDIEYCIRLREKTKILLVNSSIILHKDAYINERNPKRGQFHYNKLWISYYGIRNRVWIGKKYSKNKIYLDFSIIKYYLLSLALIILFGDNKFKRIQFTTEAYLDGLKGIFDNDKPKRILYKK